MVDEVVCACCGVRQPATPLCTACGEIAQLPAGTDYYHVMGMPRALETSVDALQRRYYELSRRLHPDRYIAAPASQREASLRNMAAVNLAYRTLRNPILRARYWLSLRGDSSARRDTRLAPDLAERVIAVQELLGALRPLPAAAGREVIEARLREFQRQLRDLHDELVAAALAVFGRADRGDAEAVGELEVRLVAQTYVAKLIQDIDAGLAA